MYSPHAVEQALALAHRNEEERRALDRFIAAVLDLLRRPAYLLDGCAVSFGAYLSAIQADGGRSGDEQPVVDELMRALLDALGFAPVERGYQGSLAGAGPRAVPDFSVRVPELLGAVPLFVVEDKSTAVRDLAQARRGDRDESPREQLRRYAQSGRVYGRAGLLCNGWRLEAWQFGSGDACLVDLDLHGLAASAVAGTPLTEVQRNALAALFARFSRQAFLQAERSASDIVKRPRFTPEMIARINEGPMRTGDAAELGRLDAEWLEALWREHAIDVRRAPDRLVETLRGLIELLTDDVAHQLHDALIRAAEFRAAIEEAERDADLAGRLERIALYRPQFAIEDEEWKGLCVAPLQAWARHPRIEALGTLLAEIVGSLDAHYRGTPGNGAAARRKVLADLRQSLEAYCHAALDLHLQRIHLENGAAAATFAERGFSSWKESVSASVLVGASEEVLRAEFARQTSYIYIIRLLLVRVCEDKGLFQRKLSDGGLVLWQESSGRWLDYASGHSYDYLTRMAYECAQNIYLHFYGASRLFDWYRLDDKMLLRVLVVLNAFNLAAIDTDIIGAVYERYLEGRREQGRFYTRRPVVRAMLDLAGHRGGEVLARRVLDDSCGSGSFLVESCRRILERFRGADGRIPASQLGAALAEARGRLYGIDINPFACYLAETNLLIQVLDLVREAQVAGIELPVERFHIYRADSLLVDEEVAAAPDAWSHLLLADEDAVPELLKARVAAFRGGFELVIGNPPYVRADVEAPNYKRYRRMVESQSWFTTQHQKWDLYVPFIEQAARLLADGADARACLITINSIATAPYAERLREMLAQKTTLHEVVFCEGLRLFQDADWLDNIVFTFSRGAPPAGHRIRRLLATAVVDGTLQLSPIDEPVQSEIEPARLFTTRPTVDLDLSNTRRWEEICYVSVGMVLNSDEKVAEGEIVAVPAAYEPQRFGEELVEDLGANGKRIRHRSFKRDDLVAPAADAIHTRRYLDPRNVLRGGIGPTVWLEYGPHTRCPGRVRRPTFPELYNRPKIVFGTFKGVAVDLGTNGEFVTVSDSVRLAIPWHRLEGVDNRSLREARSELQASNLYDPALSRDFSEWYLCAVALSEPVQQWLAANKRSMKEHVYPDDIRAIPVKTLSPAEQQPFIEMEKERHALWAELGALEAAGYGVGAKVTVPVRALAARFLREHPGVARATIFNLAGRGLFQMTEGFLERSLAGARAKGVEVIVDKRVAARVPPEMPGAPAFATFLGRYLGELPGTFADHQRTDELPVKDSDIAALVAFIAAEEEGVRRRKARIEAIGREIDERAWGLYRRGA